MPATILDRDNDTVGPYNRLSASQVNSFNSCPRLWFYEKKLHFNYKDIFLSPRLALSPKKIWVFILGNLYGYIAYWVLSFMAMILSGVEINEGLYDYGVYPYLSATFLHVSVEVVFFTLTTLP